MVDIGCHVFNAALTSAILAFSIAIALHLGHMVTPVLLSKNASILGYVASRTPALDWSARRSLCLSSLLAR